MKRIKEKPLKTRAEAVEKLADFRKICLQINTAECAQNRALAAVNDRYVPLIDELTTQRDALVSQLAAWAKANPAEFGKQRSIETEDGTMGFRLGNLSLETIGSVKWPDVVAILKNLHQGAEFIRVAETVNKEAILDRREELTESGLRALGLRVSQVDRFYAEPKLIASEHTVTHESGGAL